MFVNIEKTKATVNFLFVLPTWIMIKIVDEYKIANMYYCMIMESRDWF